MRQIYCLLLLVLASAACRSTGPAAAPGPDWEPLASAVSPCGRYTLRLEHAEWREEKGQRPRLKLQMALRSDSPDALLCGSARVTDLNGPDGAEFREEGLKGLSSVDSRWGNLIFYDLEVYNRSDRLLRLRVECHVLRVLSWRTYAVSCPTPGDGKEFLCPPYHVSASGDAESCHVGACCQDDWRAFPPAQRDLFSLLGHGWVAGSVVLTDASGRRLDSWGASGSGGHTVAHYGPPLSLEPGAEAPPPVAYPVTGTLRLPEKYVVEVVPFEFTSLPLVRPEQAQPAATESTEEDRGLEKVLFPLSDQELYARGITSVDQPGRKDWAVAWTEDRGPKFEAVDRVLQGLAIPAFGSCDLGFCGWYVKREDFFRARRALVADPEVVRLGVMVVKPRAGPE